RGHEYDEPSRAGDVCAPAFRGLLDRRHRTDRRHRSQLRQATHLPSGPKDSRGARGSQERPVSHLSDDDLVLRYYGEDGPRIVAAERHLRSCAHCAGAYETLARTLSAVIPPEFVEAPGVDLPAFRQLIRDRSKG